MIIFSIIEIAVVILALLLIVTQIAIPVWVGRQMFPMFRKQGSLEMKAAALEQEAVESELQKKLNEREKEIKNDAN